MALNSIILLAEESTEDLGSVMAQAGLNTLMGISIVFLSLTFISVIIALFGNVGKIQNRKEAKAKAEAAAKAAAAAPAEEEIVEDVSDDEEIVAVIMAAIYAFEAENGGYVPEDGLVVRSIKKINQRRK